MEFDDPSKSVNPNATNTTSITSHDVPIFDYQPLDETKQQIRLLRLWKPRTGEELGCNIVTRDLYTRPNYIALSYVWGCAQPTHSLLIQGKRLHIRQNLYRFLLEYASTNRSALKRYRTPLYERLVKAGALLWVDQICIDQSNIRERNHQVNLMSRIYQQCEFVITWIGDGDGSGVCSTAAREFNKSFRPEALAQILCNSYFTRLWIVQEVLLAPYISVLVEGGEWLLWSDIQGAVAHMSNDDMQRLQAARSVAAPLLHAWLPKNLKRRRELDWVFRSFHTCSCENPRDKVFGLMGLVSSGAPGRRFSIQVDYSKSVYDTFFEVAVQWHRCYKALSSPESTSNGLKYYTALREAMRAHERQHSERYSLSHMWLMEKEEQRNEWRAKGPEELLKVLIDLGLSMGLDKVTIENAIQVARSHAANTQQSTITTSTTASAV